ncbi:MAG TPA: hypothetical protein VGN39_02705 [Terriglobales bacterium]|jgi:hypothetical protein|nr:hypothetical protein [Terriglobales bacterium]
MNNILRKCEISLTSLLFVAGMASMASAATKTYTGKVSDAMCGAEHMEPGVSAAACTRACVAKGSKYALVVGSKVYTLDGEDKAVLDELDKLADKQAKVTGTADGDTIKVTSVVPAK